MTPPHCLPENVLHRKEMAPSAQPHATILMQPTKILAGRIKSDIYNTKQPGSLFTGQPGLVHSYWSIIKKVDKK